MAEDKNKDGEDRQFTLPDPADVYKKAGAAFQGVPWLHQPEYRQSEEVLIAAAVLSEKFEERKLKDRKHDAINRIKGEMARATDQDTLQALRELLELLEDATTPKALEAALASVEGKLVAVVSKGGDDKGPDINAMHKDLYANDAVYRAEVDKTMERSDKETKVFDKEQGKLDAIAAEKGYASPKHDQKRAELEAEIEKLEKETPPNPKLLELRIKRLDIIQEQNEERRKQAEAKGDKENAEKFSHHEPIIQEQRKLQLENLEHLKKQLLSAMERNLEKQARTPAEIKEELSIASERFDKEHDVSRKNNKEIDKVTQQLQAVIAKYEAEQENPPQKTVAVEAPSNKQIESILAGSKIEKLQVLPQVQTVSAAENVAPNASPTGGSPAPNKHDLS